MKKSYIQRFQKFSDRLMDPELANHARKKDSNTFTRKMGFLASLNLEIISNRKRSGLCSYLYRDIYNRESV